MRVLEGFALTWHDEALVGGRRERFEPYAFREPLVAKLVVVHDGRAGAVLASTGGGRLQLAQDDHGLRFAAELLDDLDGRRALAAVRYGGLQGCSFGFRPLEQDEDEDGVVVVRATLREVTLCSNGACRRGAAWAAGAAQLPPHLEALRARWHSSTTARRPGRVLEERTEFQRGLDWAASLR